MVTNHFGITGIGTVMMNYGKALDKNKYDLTILAGKPISEKYEKECLENGIHLEALPSRHGNPKKHYIALWKALREGHYDIVHDHGSSSMMAVELTIAVCSPLVVGTGVNSMPTALKSRQLAST